MRDVGWVFASRVVAVVILSTATSRADRGDPRLDESITRANVDTTYGRIDGDVGVSAGLGATFGPSAPRGVVDLRFRYLDTAGVFASYEDALVSSSAEPKRVLAAGFELRPLFLARWLSGNEVSHPRLDLFIDSLGLELGAFFQQPLGESFMEHPGLQAGLGVEVPILATATGPWIGVHGGIRWSNDAVQGIAVAGSSDRSVFLALTVAYHQLFFAHLVDVRDQGPR